MRDIDKLFLTFLAFCAVLLWMGSVLDRDEAIPQFTGNESYFAAMEEQRRQEMKIWLAPNETGNYTITVPNDTNVSIWKGDKMVCYIPRGAKKPLFFHWTGTWC
ncbi:hypothetical protein M0R72_20000 [Candidatus Pacearchaeota archaeon]|nr:hypothetical protein [Candidatus Pacearchaeota archaeon]